MTYKAPKPKTNMRPTFCFVGSCNCFKSGIGIENITRFCCQSCSTTLITAPDAQVLELESGEKRTDISRDIQRSVGEPKGKFIHASSSDRCPPEISDRNTHQSGADDCPAAIDCKNPDHDVAEFDDFGCCENALVLENDGDFCED